MGEPEKKHDPDNMNYNDRIDGYGFGEPESNDNDHDYEKDPHFARQGIDLGEGYRSHKNEPYTKDENGQRNQYGPVDQYVFRDVHFNRRVRREKESGQFREERSSESRQPE